MLQDALDQGLVALREALADRAQGLPPYRSLQLIVYTYVYKYICIHICNIYIYIHVYIYIYISLSLDMYMYIYIYIYMYMYIHTYLERERERENMIFVRRRLNGYLAQRVPSLYLASSSRTCLSCEALEGMLPWRTGYPLSQVPIEPVPTGCWAARRCLRPTATSSPSPRSGRTSRQPAANNRHSAC